MECIHYLDYLIDEENKIMLVAKNRDTLNLYFECFGESSASEQLYKGLIQSYMNYFKSRISENDVSVLLEEKLDFIGMRIKRSLLSFKAD